jgi:hypothetical protein
MTDRTGGRAFPRTVLGVVWLLAALLVGCPGLLISAMSDWQDERVAGWVLIVLALFGGATAVMLLGGKPARPLSLVVSAVFLIGGVAAALAMTADGVWFGIDLLIFGGVPIVAALTTGLLALLTKDQGTPIS